VDGAVMMTPNCVRLSASTTARNCHALGSMTADDGTGGGAESGVATDDDESSVAEFAGELLDRVIRFQTAALIRRSDPRRARFCILRRANHIANARQTNIFVVRNLEVFFSLEEDSREEVCHSMHSPDRVLHLIDPSPARKIHQTGDARLRLRLL